MGIVLNKVSYFVGDKGIIHDVSLTIERGSMTAVMGLNGSGKTTLLRLMGGFLKPTQGTIRIGMSTESTLSTLSTRELARLLAYVPPDFPVLFPFTVKEFVLMGRFAWQQGLFNSAFDYQRVHDILSRLQLLPFEKRSVLSLSSGERQRVLLARALVQETPIILLDEPLNHLDIKYRREMLSLLKEENQKNGKTIVAAMHELHEVREFFEDVILLKQGRLAAIGSKLSVINEKNVKDVFEVEVDVKREA